MRILHAADLHVGKLIRGRSRLPEHRTVLANLVALAEEHQPDVVVLPGDTFDRASPGPDEIALVAKTVTALVKVGSEVLITSGNHDGPTTLRDMEHKVTAWLEAFEIPHVHAHSAPTSVIIAGSVFYTLPYPHKRSFDHLVEKSLRDRTEAVSAALENIIETQYEELARRNPGQPITFVGHLSTLNAQLSADQAMRMGWDVTIREEVLDPFYRAILGHIHRHQLVGRSGAYSGSPIYSDFGEASQTKGFLLWDDDFPELLESGCLPMVRILTRESDAWEVPPDVDRSFEGWVQVQLEPDRGGQPSFRLRRSIRDLFPSAAGVWVDVLPKPQVARVRLEKGMEHSSGIDLVAAYLDSKGLPKEPALTVARELMTQVDGDA